MRRWAVSKCITRSMGSGEPVVLLHGAFMAITDDWSVWINELAKTRKVIAVEMQGHGRTADIKRDITYENLADDVAALLDYLKIPNADIIGYSLGGGAAMHVCDPPPGKSAKGRQHFSPVQARRMGQGSERLLADLHVVKCSKDRPRKPNIKN